jgi:hypothetical protein
MLYLTGMASPAWHYVLKFIITGDAAAGKSFLLVHLDQRFLANPVRWCASPCFWIPLDEFA